MYINVSKLAECLCYRWGDGDPSQEASCLPHLGSCLTCKRRSQWRDKLNPATDTYSGHERVYL